MLIGVNDVWHELGGRHNGVSAEKYNLPFVALQDIFDDACKRAPAFYWLRDGVHPTPMGHWLIKNEWIKAFREAWIIEK